MKNCISITYKYEANKKQLIRIGFILVFGYTVISYIFQKTELKHRKPRFHDFNIYLEWIKEERHFSRDWDELMNRKYDFERLELSCASNFTWTKDEAIPWYKHKTRTEHTKGYFNIWKVNDANEFSSFTLQTQHPNGSLKLIGGDHWRVRVRGPSSPYVIKTDFQNGSYQFKFLPVIPGSYELFIWLEYTLCAGLKEPPSDWFRRGTIQGKEQKQGSLNQDMPFINKQLWAGSQINFNVPDGKSKGLVTGERMRQACLDKQTKCKLLWNGFGNWINETNWLPLCPESSELRYPRNEYEKGVLWLFGDSVSTQFYHQIKFKPLCKTLFTRCMYTYNWLYALENYNATLGHYSRRNTTIEKTIWNDDDYNADQIVNELRQVLLHPAMATNQSVLLLNYGLHFTESLNYTNFKLTIDKIIDLLESEARCQVIWRTTTSLNRHKYTQPNRHATRFMTSPRVELYNAYATSQFCKHQFDVLDVYPLTDSYPKETGSMRNPRDPVHYRYHVVKPMEELLERVFAPK